MTHASRLVLFAHRSTLVLTCIGLLALTACGGDGAKRSFVTTCHEAHELDEATLEPIHDGAKLVLERMAARDFETLHAEATPTFLANVPKDAFVAMNEMDGLDLIAPSKATPEDLYLVRSTGGVTGPFPCVSVASNDPERVDVTQFSEQEAAHLVFHFPGEPMHYRATITLLRDGEAWKMGNLFWGAMSLDGKGVLHYRTRAEAHRDGGRPLAAAACAHVAMQMALYGVNITTHDTRTTRALYEEIRNSDAYGDALGTWSTADGAHELYTMAPSLHEGDTIVRISYHSLAEKGDEAAIQAEAARLHERLQRDHPALAEDFERVLWFACWQRPVDPRVQYEHVEVSLPLDAAQTADPLGAPGEAGSRP